MARINQNGEVSGTYRVVDAPMVGIFFLVILGSILASYFIITSKDPSNRTFLIFSIGALVISFLLFNSNRKGFVCDVENDTLEYPGGGIAADSFLSYISPMYWLQYFRRFKLAISEIRHFDVYNTTKTKVNSQGNVSQSKRYMIDIDGEFGAISFSFMSKGKRDELYSLLVSIIHQQGTNTNADMPVMDYDE